MNVLRYLVNLARVYIIELPFYLWYRIVLQPRKNDAKIMVVDPGKNVYKRYLYTFLKFFHLQGYAIYVRPGKKLFRQIRREPYASYLIKERILHFGKPGADVKQNVFVVNDRLLSPDYFNGLRDKEKYTFHFPITQHPMMYHTGWWNEVIPVVKRKKSLFMAGNFDSAVYSSAGVEQNFNVRSRNAVYEYLENKKLLFRVNSLSELHDFINSELDNKIILVNRLVTDIPMDGLRAILAKFEFFFALPGMVMPFSHNIIEAMSSGCIPFLEEEYAGLFRPVLANEIHAVTFSGLEDISRKISYLFTLSDDGIENLRQNINNYYSDHLTPGSVVARIEQSRFQRIYLQAEDYSVSLLNNKSRKFF